MVFIDELISNNLIYIIDLYIWYSLYIIYVDVLIHVIIIRYVARRHASVTAAVNSATTVTKR